MNRLKLIFTVVAAFGFLTSNSAFGADVYVLKGFGGVWSKGMKNLSATINKDLKRSKVKSKLYSSGADSKIKKEILRSIDKGTVSYPIIIIGHSAGAVTASKIVKDLGKKGIKTSIIGVDPGFPTPKKLGVGVQYAKAYRIETDRRTHYFKKGPGFSGDLVNVRVNQSLDKDLDHTSIDDSTLIHREIIKDIRAIIGR